MLTNKPDYLFGGVDVLVDEDEREALFFARRLLFPVDPLLARSVVFIESDVPVVVPLLMVPVPVEYEPVVPEPVVVDPVEPEPVVVPVEPDRGFEFVRCAFE